MCGIAGVYSLGGTVPPRVADELAGVSACLRSRGPDAEGSIYLDRFNAVHRRLSIIDIEGGAQPMADPESRAVIVFNGEIYNYVELRKRLIDKGHKFRTQSDTEVLLKSYADKGIGMLNDLNGMFSFALFDEHRDCVYLARDRFGEKPLFYSRVGDLLYFASQADAMVRFRECSPDLSKAGLLQYFAAGYVSGPDSIFDGIRQLRHGHYLCGDSSGTIREQAYYQRPTLARTRTLENEQIDEALASAIHLRLRADVPVATLLSGGIDSSLITAFAQRGLDEKIHSFAFGWKGLADELPFARKVAESVGTIHHEIELDRDLFMADIEGVVAAMDMPQADSASFVVYQLSKEIAKNGVKVVLSGEGGDELFGGYPWYAQRHDARALARRILRTPTRRARDYVTGRLQFQQATLERGFPSDLVRELIEGRTVLYSRLGDSATGRMAFDYESLMPWGLLPKVDRMSMAHSIEVRAPLLDHHLVELWAELPVVEKVRGMELKVRVKRFCDETGIIPTAAWNRPKMGMNLPVSWLVRQHESFFRETLATPRCTAVELFGRTEVESWFSDLSQESSEGWSEPAQRIWSGSVFELWRDRLRTSVPLTTGINAVAH